MHTFDSKRADVVVGVGFVGVTGKYGEVEDTTPREAEVKDDLALRGVVDAVAGYLLPVLLQPRVKSQRGAAGALQDNFSLRKRHNNNNDQ